MTSLAYGLQQPKATRYSCSLPNAVIPSCFPLQSSPAYKEVQRPALQMGWKCGPLGTGVGSTTATQGPLQKGSKDHSTKMQQLLVLIYMS